MMIDRQVRDFTTLTEREREVLAQLGGGERNRWLVRRLVVTERTVRAHTSSIVRKLNLMSRFEAAIVSNLYAEDIGGLRPWPDLLRCSASGLSTTAEVPCGRNRFPQGASRVPGAGRGAGNGAAPEPGPEPGPGSRVRARPRKRPGRRPCPQPGRAVLTASTSIIHIGWPPVPNAAESA